MNASPPRIERVTVKDLPALAERLVDRAEPGDFIPITKHRAQAMAHNPNAKPGDTAMLVAWDGDECVGYFGTMPVMLRHAGKLHKVFWLTTWNVAPRYIGKGLGSALMQAALDLDVDLAIVGSKPARRVSAKFGFHEIKPLEYVRIDYAVAGRFNPVSLLLRALRKGFSLIGLRLPIEGLSKQFEELFEFVFGPLVRPIFLRLVWRSLKAEMDALRSEQVKALDADWVEKPAAGRTAFYRDARVVNWMLAHPWVQRTGQSESERMDYVFTDARPLFEMMAFKQSVPGSKEIGYLCLQASLIGRKIVVKVLDHRLLPGHARGQLGAALTFAQKQLLGDGVIEGPMELEAALPGWLRPLLVSHRQRITQVHPRAKGSPLDLAWQQLEPSYVDGDMAFT